MCCVSDLFYETGETARGTVHSATRLDGPYQREPVPRSPRRLLLCVLCVWVPSTCPHHTRESTLTTHDHGVMTFGHHVPCTHLLTAWLVSAVSSSRSWAGRTSPRESFVCEKAHLKRRLSSNPCGFWSRSDELRSLCHSRMGADHTCSTSSLRAAHTNSRTCNALFGAARTNSAPEARTSGPFYRFKRTLLGSLSVIF